jgi:hypothetical protein
MQDGRGTSLGKRAENNDSDNRRSPPTPYHGRHATIKSRAAMFLVNILVCGQSLLDGALTLPSGSNSIPPLRCVSP